LKDIFRLQLTIFHFALPSKDGLDKEFNNNIPLLPLKFFYYLKITYSGFLIELSWTL